ncbi:MAG: MCE family protein [Calditrichaeota bacterium]|nr:MAG: MCE family protein [Calditrichota bacterium]
MNMKRTTKVKWGDLKIGILLTFAVAVMFWASLSGGGTSIFESKKMFKCYFENINGLVPGAPVWMSGVEVGNVKSVNFVNLDAERQVELICRVKKEVWGMMTQDARVQLGTIGFLGDKYVEILPGTKGGEAIAEMSVVPTKDAGSAPAVFSAAESSINDVRSTIQNVDTMLTRINRGEGTLGQLATNDKMYQDMTKLMSSLTILINELQKNQERIVASLEQTSNNIGSLSQKVDDNAGTVGRLFNDPELYDNLSKSTASLDSIMYKINTAEGNLGMLVNDTALYSEMSDLMARMNSLISDIQANPRKYFKFSVF